MDNIERLERRHFALPAAFVLTLLAFLFFGFPRTPMPVVPDPPVKTPPPTGDDVTKKTDDPPPLIAMEESDSVGKPAEASGGPPPPVEIDQSWSQRQDVFFVPMERTRPHPGNGDIWMIPAYYGPGEGHGDHPGPANNIIPARLLDKPPQARSQASPVYPFKEKSESVTGTVEVEFIVDETGAVVNPRVVSSTHRAFEEPTLRAVEKWRFVPGRRLGQVVSFRMRVPVLFHLND